MLAPNRIEGVGSKTAVVLMGISVRAFWLSIFLIVACGTAGDDIQRQYTETARNLGLVPVYPPREEFQIGDVFAVSFGQNAADEIDVEDVVRVWIGELPEVARAAEEFMASRIVFQASTPPNATPALGQSDLFDAGLTRRQDVSVESLPIAAFPSITADAGFSSGFGLARALQAIGIATSNRTEVTLSFNDVRTYWVERLALDLNGVQRTVGFDIVRPNEQGNLPEECRGPELDLSDGECTHLNPILVALQQRERIARDAGRQVSDNRCTTVIVVTRVYLTREIDFTYANGEIIAAGIRRTEAGSNVADIPSPQRITLNVTNNDGVPDLNVQDSEIQALRAQVDALAAQDSRGGGLNFESWNALGITFSRTYARPVAIGYEGFSFPVAIRDTRPDRVEQTGYDECRG